MSISGVRTAYDDGRDRPGRRDPRPPPRPRPPKQPRKQAPVTAARAGGMSMGVPMPEQPDDQLSSDGQPFTGAHPTNREFVEQLRAWGFTQRKEDGVHVVFRGPKGGTVRVIRSQLGRADTVAWRTRPPGSPVSRPRSSGPGPRAARASGPGSRRAWRPPRRGTRRRPRPYAHLPGAGPPRGGGPAAGVRPGRRAVREPGDPRASTDGQRGAAPARETSTGSGPGSTSGQRASAPPPGTSRQPAAPAGPLPGRPPVPPGAGQALSPPARAYVRG